MTGGADRERAPAMDAGSALEAMLAFAIGGVAAVDGAAPRLRYRGHGEGYSDARSCQGRVLGIARGVRLGFTLPAGLLVEFVELRFAAVPGLYRVERLLVDGVDLGELPPRAMRAGGYAVPARGAGLSVAGDMRAPVVEFDLRATTGDRVVAAPDANAAETGLAIEVVVLREDAATVGLDQLRREVDVACRELRQTLLSHGDEVFTLAREQRLGRDSRGERELILDERAAELAAQLEAHRAGIADLRGLTDEVRERLVDVGHGQADAAEGSAARHALAMDALGALGAAVAGQQRALEAVREELSRLSSSIENVFWRRWLRRLRGPGR